MNSNHRHGNSANWFLTGIFLLTLVVGSFVIASCEEDQPEEQPAAATETGELADDKAVVGEIVEGEFLSLSNNVFSPEEEIVIAYVYDDSFDDTAWVGIVPSNIPHGDEDVNDQHDIKYEYLYGKSGELSFFAPVEPGEYDFRLHNSDGNGKEVDSVSFTVR